MAQVVGDFSRASLCGELSLGCHILQLPRSCIAWTIRCLALAHLQMWLAASIGAACIIPLLGAYVTLGDRLRMQPSRRTCNSTRSMLPQNNYDQSKPCSPTHNSSHPDDDGRLCFCCSNESLTLLAVGEWGQAASHTWTPAFQMKHLGGYCHCHCTLLLAHVAAYPPSKILTDSCCDFMSFKSQP